MSLLFTVIFMSKPFFMHTILSITGVYHISTLGINHPAPLNIFWGRANVYYIIHIWFMSCNILVSFSSCICVPFFRQSLQLFVLSKFILYFISGVGCFCDPCIFNMKLLIRLWTYFNSDFQVHTYLCNV